MHTGTGLPAEHRPASLVQRPALKQLRGQAQLQRVVAAVGRRLEHMRHCLLRLLQRRVVGGGLAVGLQQLGQHLLEPLLLLRKIQLHRVLRRPCPALLLGQGGLQPLVEEVPDVSRVVLEVGLVLCLQCVGVGGRLR